MNAEVLEEMVLLAVASVALCAGVRPLSWVDSPVAGELRLAREALPTVVALVGLPFAGLSLVHYAAPQEPAALLAPGALGAFGGLALKALLL